MTNTIYSTHAGSRLFLSMLSMKVGPGTLFFTFRKVTKRSEWGFIFIIRVDIKGTFVPKNVPLSPSWWICQPDNMIFQGSSKDLSIQTLAHANLCQLIDYRVGSHQEQKLDKCSPGAVRKKVSFQFNFEAVQREFRVAEMHWECIPGSRRSEVESTRTYRLGFRPGDWQRPYCSLSLIVSKI